ncbi:MAG: glycosyltransferase [Actinomycetota bacterium]
MVQVIARLNVGGPAALVLAVADGLDPDRYESVVLHGEVDEGEADWRDIRDGSSLVRPVAGLGRAVRAGDDARAMAVLVRELRRLRPDIVHTHTAKAGALGRTAARLATRNGRRPRIVHTFHGHVLHGYFRPAVRRGIITVERQLARGTDRIITVGSPVRDDLLAAGIGRLEQYAVVPPGVDPLPTVPAAEARRSLGVPDGRPVVAFVGRLTRIKRPDRAVDAMRAVREAGIDAHLVVAGDGDLRHTTERRAAVLGDAVTFLGWTSDIGRVLSAADVIVLTSDNEGMPVTLVEAAHAGVPAVATDVGGVAEVVADGTTGLVVAPTAAAVGEGLVGLLGDPERRGRMGTAATAAAARHFTTASMVGAHTAIYEEVLS